MELISRLCPAHPKTNACFRPNCSCKLELGTSRSVCWLAVPAVLWSVQRPRKLFASTWRVSGRVRNAPKGGHLAPAETNRRRPRIEISRHHDLARAETAFGARHPKSCVIKNFYLRLSHIEI